MSISRAARSMAAAVALAIGGLALPGNASAQAINVFDFSCGSTPFSVNVDVRGLGGTDVCVTSVATVDLSCACVDGSGNCPQAANKAVTPTTIKSSASLQPMNGRVFTTVTLPISVSDASCTAPSQCGTGQTVKLIEFTTEDSQPTFTMCTTTAPVGSPCDCTDGLIAGPLNCGPTGATTFPGGHNSCLKLFK